MKNDELQKLVTKGDLLVLRQEIKKDNLDVFVKLDARWDRRSTGLGSRFDRFRDESIARFDEILTIKDVDDPEIFVGCSR